NKKPFRLAGVLAQLVGFAGALSREVWLPHVGVCTAQERVRRCELGIDFNRALEKRHRAFKVVGELHLPGGGVQLPGFERWRTGLAERDRVLLDAGQRFAGFASEPGSKL